MFSSKFDAYGFEFPDGFDHTPYEAFTAQYISVLARRAAQWKKLLGNSKSVKRSRTGTLYTQSTIQYTVCISSYTASYVDNLMIGVEALV